MAVFNVVIAAGGTGGHIFPALAVAKALKERGVGVAFVGAGKEIEKQLIEPEGFPLYTMPSLPFVGKGIGGAVRALLAGPSVLLKSFSLIRKLDPAALIGFGGYPSFFPLCMGRMVGRVVVIQEQNVQIGSANKLLSLIAKRIYAVHGAKGFLRETNLFHISNPVRKEFLAVPGWNEPDLDNPFTIAIVGGSQGATTINSAVLGMLPELLKRRVRIIHQTGFSDVERVKAAYESVGYDRYQVEPFINNIVKVYSQSHLVVCRAGAMTVAEVSASGRPAIFIPLPIAGGHQRLNTLHLLKQGGCEVVDQTDGWEEKLKTQVLKFVDDIQATKAMAERTTLASQVGKKSSSETIADAVFELAGKTN